ncbi:uncharacterized protein [Mycetomoellerius zeteki]|uniref:uncharacterized protein n=1 Tax=Mycetomoellerius zeteki TaxID=64791 RepID=UPI00084EBCAC|nr:PREDICTED: uncharacterized protein LOC108727892 [Trachymyrmex zeteki]
MNDSIRFIKNNPKIIFTRADKGNTTVALDRDSYIDKITRMLDDKKTYIKLTKNPINKLAKNVQELLKKWKSKNFISEPTYRKLRSSDGILPRAYALPKIHKEGTPFRIIISSLDSPMYSLASFLHEIISKNVERPFSKIDNSFQLVKKLRGTQIDENFSLISLDVVSLFTNVPIDFAIKSIEKRWNKIKKGISIPKKEFIGAVSLVLESTFFAFNDEYYQQKFGTPMGSPLSPIIADLVMQDLETEVLGKLEFPVPFYIRYVDDIIMAAPVETIGQILTAFNAVHNRLQFTLEIGGESINFLDVTIIKNDGMLECDWYHKPTFSGRYLNFLSSHPISQKRGVVFGMIDRAILLSEEKFYYKNIKLVINTLLRNDYPIEFIFDTISLRLKCLFSRRGRMEQDSKSKNDDSERDEGTPWFLIPYTNNTSKDFLRICKKENLRPAFYSNNKLSRFIKVQKDVLPKNQNKNVIYKITCKDCDASYVGQTGRKLISRITEHRNHINWNTNSQSVITNHRTELNHDFDWENIQILDRERILNKRLISEKAHILMQKNGLNLRSDREGLHHTYTTMLCEMTN